MNTNRQFDEYIKEQFNDYVPDVHPRIWENIVAEKDKRRPAGFWISLFNNRNKLLVLALMVALSSGGAWIYFNKKTTADSNTQTIFKNDNGKTDNKSPIAETKKYPDESLNTIGLNTDNGSADKNGTGSRTTLSSKGRSKAAINSPALQADADENNNSNYQKANKKHYTGLASVLINTTSPSLTEEDENEEQSESQGTLLGRLNFQSEKLTLKRNTGKKEELKFNPIIYLPDCPLLEKDAAGNKKYFEFYAGPDYAIRSLQDTGKNSTYLQQRKESNTFKSAFSAGVRYTKVFNNSMSVRGGFNYSQINEKFTYNQGNVIQITYIINNNGDTIGSYSTTGTRYKTTINRYRSIDIPLVIGYELGNGKLHANINAGAVINIYSWQKGDVLDMSGNPVSITTGKGSSPYQFKTNAGIGFIGAVSVYYKLTDQLHILAEPYFRYNFSPMNKETITLKQKYQTVGLRLGIRLDLK